MTFFEQLDELLPQDLPHRQLCLRGATRHLELIVEANQYFNLTRILDPREAAIKHVVDSVLPWTLFAGASHLVDAGSGAGFPGLPLALIMPDTTFTLLESTQKKARFIESTAAELGLKNVRVYAERAEDWLQKNRVGVVTARAVAPLTRAIPLFAPAWKRGTTVLLYKGPDVETEMAEAALVAQRARCTTKLVREYDLPDGLGKRTIVALSKA